MEIYTGNFANLKKYQENGLFPISIALSSRYFNGDSYKKLAPDWDFKDDPEEIYTPKFEKKLKALSLETVKAQLALISKGKDIVLLCHEKNGVFCHRHLVNKWIGGRGEFGVLKIEQKKLF